MVADIAFVIAQEAFAGEFGLDPAFFPGGLDKFHQAAEFPAGELQFRVLRSAADREDGE